MIDLPAGKPPEEAAHYNPAFLSALIAVAANDYERRAQEPMPWPLPFIILPLVVASDLRGELPRSTARFLVTWAANHPLVRAEVPYRARALAPLTRASLRFGLRSGTLEIAGRGLYGAVTRQRLSSRVGGDALEAVDGAAFLGRWFAKVEAPQVYALLGAAP